MSSFKQYWLVYGFANSCEENSCWTSFASSYGRGEYHQWSADGIFEMISMLSR